MHFKLKGLEYALPSSPQKIAVREMICCNTDGFMETVKQ